MGITIGSIVDGKYKVVRQVGKGGMGAVYAAEHLRIRRTVAIKVLHAEVAQSPEIAQRFEREAQAAAQIGSQHIVEVLDCGVADDGQRFMVMEFLDGETLRQRLKRGGRMLPEQAAPIFMQLLEGLAAAHSAGIIHRDLKPDNVWLERERAGQRDWVKILDFGISKFSEISGDEQMTRTGAVMGTLFFMSPEQARSAHLVDARSDLYAVGAMLFQALTGDVPFRASSLAEILFKIVFDPLPDPREREPALDEGICAVLRRAIARDPADRFQSALEFRQALAPFAHGPPQIAALSSGAFRAQEPPPPPARPSTPSQPFAPPPPSGQPPPSLGPPSSPTRAPLPSASSLRRPPVNEVEEMSSSNLATSASVAILSPFQDSVARRASEALSSEPDLSRVSPLARRATGARSLQMGVASVTAALLVGGLIALGVSSTRARDQQGASVRAIPASSSSSSPLAPSPTVSVVAGGTDPAIGATGSTGSPVPPSATASPSSSSSTIAKAAVSATVTGDTTKSGGGAGKPVATSTKTVAKPTGNPAFDPGY